MYKNNAPKLSAMIEMGQYFLISSLFVLGCVVGYMYRRHIAYPDGRATWWGFLLWNQPYDIVAIEHFGGYVFALLRPQFYGGGDKNVPTLIRLPLDEKYAIGDRLEVQRGDYWPVLRRFDSKTGKASVHA
ncbi:MAG: hypothetical protein Q8P73_05230 [bacterium]|nr:hypothetical protein [bacterium]